MAGRRPLTQVPDQMQASGSMSREADMGLAPYSVQHGIAEVYTKFTEYAEIIARGGRLAPQFGNSLFYVMVFGQPRPHLIEGDGSAPIEWSDVLGASPGPEDFQVQANGMYRCRIRGSWIEVSEANFIKIQTCPTEHSLQSLQDLSDEQKETRVRLQLSTHLHHTGFTLHLFLDAVQKAIDALNRPSTSHTNLNAEPSGPISATDNASASPDDATSFGSDIPFEGNPQDSQSTSTVQSEPGMASESQAGRQDESASSLSENRARTYARYTRLEEERAPEFLKHLVNTGATGDEVEEEYHREFGIHRTTRGLFKKFRTKGGWALIASHEEAKRQKAMSS